MTWSSTETIVGMSRMAPLSSPSGRRHVPPADDGGLPLPAQHAHGARVEREQRAVAGPQAEPAGGQHPEDVPVGHEQHVTTGGPHPLEYAVDPTADVVGPLAAGPAVAPQRPVRPLAPDVG